MMSTLRRALSSIDVNNNYNNNNQNERQYQHQIQHRDKRPVNNSKDRIKSRSSSKMERELNSEHIKKLLEQLYLRGPETVGVFRKSPNAKHCRELKQKLDANALDSLDQYQVVVIASVFKVSTYKQANKRFFSRLPSLPSNYLIPIHLLCFTSHLNYPCSKYKQIMASINVFHINHRHMMETFWCYCSMNLNNTSCLQ